MKIFEHEHLFESTVMIAFDIVQGFLLTGFSVILILGMMLLREFVSILSREQQQQPATTNNRRNRNRNFSNIELSETENSVTGSGITEISHSTESPISSISPLSPTSPRIQPLSPLRRHSELHHRASPLSPISSTVLPASPSSVTSNNFWLDQVHPKEYRNYLRRIPLYIIRMERNNRLRHRNILTLHRLTSIFPVLSAKLKKIPRAFIFLSLFIRWMLKCTR